MDDPVRHNKTAFDINSLGASEINRLETLAGALIRPRPPQCAGEVDL